VSKVLAFIICRSLLDTPRGQLFERTVREGREKAGCDFEWKMWTNAIVNRGQHVVFNEALAEAKERGFDYLLRIDDDIEFLSHRWLAKMLEAAALLGPNFIISPTIKGLKHPPEMSQVVDVKGMPCRFLTEAIGGACRLHPVKLLTEAPQPYVSDVRLPLGFGDATGIAKWCREMTMGGYPCYMVWLDHVRVKHATAKQEEEDVAYHELHGVLQRVPYLPAWPEAYL